MDPMTVYGAYKAGKEIATDFYKLSVALTSKAYGESRVQVFQAIDFVEPIRVDEWRIKLIHYLTNRGFIPSGEGAFTLKDIVTIRDIRHEFISIIDEEEESIENNNKIGVDDGVLLVKRARFYAVPESQEWDGIRNACIEVAHVSEHFMKDVNFSKTFTGVIIKFDTGEKATKFASIVKAIEPLTHITAHENTIQVVELQLSDMDRVFSTVDHELNKTIVTRIMNKVGKTAKAVGLF